MQSTEVKFASLQERISGKIEEIRQMAGQYPGAVIIHNLRENNISYMNDTALKGFKKSWEELKDIGLDDFHREYYHSEDAGGNSPEVFSLFREANPVQVLSFFQQVRTGGNDGWEWYHTSMKVLMHDDEGRPLLTIAFAIRIDPQYHITARVNRLLEENNFIQRHYKKFLTLGKREKEVLRLLSMGMTSNEIAAELFIAYLTVETHRKNIKRKLNVHSVVELQQYARAFDLI